MISLDFKNIGSKRFINTKTFNPHMSDRLCEQFPRVDKFVDFDGANRRNGQREHKKLFLSYNSKLKTNIFETTAVNSEWGGFIEYLQSDEYINWVKDVLGIDNFDLGFEWALMDDGTDLCPHSDCCKKLGSHVFFFPYFHWRGKGGDFVFLDNHTNDQNPEISEFQKHHQIKYKSNCSILFANSKEYRNWHTVTRIDSISARRRVFQVIFWQKGDVTCYQQKTSL